MGIAKEIKWLNAYSLLVLFSFKLIILEIILGKGQTNLCRPFTYDKNSRKLLPLIIHK